MRIHKTHYLSVFALLLAAVTASSAIAAPPVQVTAAVPDSAPQGAINLDVEVSGNGFDASANVEFLVTGTTNPGGITVKRVTVQGSKKLIVNVDVADTAVVDRFDIVVTQSGGRKGKGTSLFAVLSKTAFDPCAVAGLDFPAFTYQTVVGQVEKLYVADATGTCRRLLIDTGTNNVVQLAQAAFSYPVAGTSDVGQVIWLEAGAIFGMTIQVSGSSITPTPREAIYAGSAAVLGLELGVDGTIAYAGLDPTNNGGVGSILAINLADGSVQTVFTGNADGSYASNISANEDGTLFIDWRLNPYANGARVLRIEPSCATMACATVLDSSAPGTSAPMYPAASPDDARLVYSDYLPGTNNCWLLQVIPDTGGSILNSGQPRYGHRSTWLNGQILTNGRAAPDRKGKCAETGMITRIDPATSAETALVQGRDPDGR